MQNTHGVLHFLVEATGLETYQTIAETIINKGIALFLPHFFPTQKALFYFLFLTKKRSRWAIVIYQPFCSCSVRAVPLRRRRFDSYRLSAPILRRLSKIQPSHTRLRARAYVCTRANFYQYYLFFFYCC